MEDGSKDQQRDRGLSPEVGGRGTYSRSRHRLLSRASTLSVTRNKRVVSFFLIENWFLLPCIIL